MIVVFPGHSHLLFSSDTVAYHLSLTSSNVAKSLTSSIVAKSRKTIRAY